MVTEVQLALLPEIPDMSRCRIYHRPLTDPASVEVGVGPACAKKEAIMHEELSNLPPGMTESMIPGNRPEDQEDYGEFVIFLSEEEINKLEGFVALQNIVPVEKKHPLTELIGELLEQLKEG